MTTTETITEGNKAVVISNQDGSVWANLYVNARNGMHEANITNLRWDGKTVAGAKRWAKKQFN